jgi:hypothetical protein
MTNDICFFFFTQLAQNCIISGFLCSLEPRGLFLDCSKAEFSLKMYAAAGGMNRLVAFVSKTIVPNDETLLNVGQH